MVVKFLTVSKCRSLNNIYIKCLYTYEASMEHQNCTKLHQVILQKWNEMNPFFCQSESESFDAHIFIFQIFHIFFSLLSPSQSQNRRVTFEACCSVIWAWQSASFARGERALVLQIRAARCTQSECAIEIEYFLPVPIEWMRQKRWQGYYTDMPTLDHRKSLPGVINLILMILSCC